ncbi:hypothetical protein Tco_1145655 [Tanacetum coccineum]
MAESSHQSNNSSEESTRYNPAPNVDFAQEEIKTNNIATTLYLEHDNPEYFKCVSDFISMCCLHKTFKRQPTQMFQEILVDFWYIATPDNNTKKRRFAIPSINFQGDIGLNTFRMVIRANYLDKPEDYASLPDVPVLRSFFHSIGYSEDVPAKGTLKKVCLPPKWKLLMAQIMECLGGKTGGLDEINGKDVIILYCLAKEIKDAYDSFEGTPIPVPAFGTKNWTLLASYIEGPPFTSHMMAICTPDRPVKMKAPVNTTPAGERDSKGKNPRAKPG